MNMKLWTNISAVFLVVALRDLAHATLSEARGDREDFQCPGEQGYYPHPVNCDKYYGCWNLSPTLYECPKPQLFDMKYHGCNWPELTDCQDRVRPEGAPNTKTPPPDAGGVGVSTSKPFNCPPDVEDAMFPDPEDCASYYRCVYGTSYHYNCPDSLVFNPNIGACDYEKNVVCGSRI